MSNLLLESGYTRFENRELLRHIKTPVGTKSHRPIGQYETANKVVSSAEKFGYTVTQEEYGVNPSGMNLFGLIHINNSDDEKSRLIAYRNSNSKNFSFSICAGFKILICSNMMMGSDIGECLKRRHTKNIEADLDGIIQSSFEQLPSEYDKLEGHIERMKNQAITIDEARVKIMRSIEQRLIRPSDGIHIINEFKHPRHEQFEGNNSWNLYNAYTEIIREKYSPSKTDYALRGLCTLFELDNVA
jgi:hypothetical protein